MSLEHLRARLLREVKRRKRRAPIAATLAKGGKPAYIWQVQSSIRVASPPAKPLVVYDGDCSFCRFWVRRWETLTGDQVEYAPFQDSRVAEQFPEIPIQDFEAALQLIETDGAVYNAAEAAFRALAHNSRERWLLDWYGHSPRFARYAEWVYGFIARHRSSFSALTRLVWG